MPIYCMRDDGWPKKRCYVCKTPKYQHPHCRHWFKGIDNDGCGFHMWQQAAKDGTATSLIDESQQTTEIK